MEYIYISSMWYQTKIKRQVRLKGVANVGLDEKPGSRVNGLPWARVGYFGLGAREVEGREVDACSRRVLHIHLRLPQLQSCVCTLVLPWKL